MVEFAFNTAKNTSTSHITFKLNYCYHLYVSSKKDIDPCSKSKSANELSIELSGLVLVCHENFYYAQEL